MFKKISLTLLLLALIVFPGIIPVTNSGVTQAITDNTFCNPINVDYRFSIASPSYREAADPVIVTFNNEYYLFASHSGGYWWSANLRDWNFVTPTGLNIEKFAPAILIIGSTMYYTSSESGDFYKTTNPKGGAWTYISHPHNWDDPALFRDDDGKVYCYHNCSQNGSIDVVELDPANNFAVVGSEVQCFFGNNTQHGFEVNGDNNTGGLPYIEGAWMTKYNGSYYLQYATPGTEVRSYADGCYKSAAPKGPFTFCTNSPITAKHLGFVTGTGHGSTFQDLNGKYWRVVTLTISVKYIFERRLAIFPAGFDADGLLHTNTALADYPQYIPGVATDPVTNNSPDWKLLSSGKTASASSTYSTYSVSNAFDENIRTWWSANTGNSGEWLKVDLGKNCTVNAIQVNFAEQDTTYYSGRTTAFSHKYKLEYSTDGTTWSVLVDKSANTKDVPHDYVQLTTAVIARYLRITNQGAVPGSGKFSISDLRAFGSGGGSAPAAVSSFTVARNPSDQRSATVSWSAVSGASGYVIRYGVASNKLYNNYQVLSGTSWNINSLNIGQDYYFTVDSYNDSGVTAGTLVKNAPASALSQFEAEGYAIQSGTQNETCSEGGIEVAFIENGDYIAFNNVDFGTGVAFFEARVASATSGGNIEVRLDSLTGTLVGTCAVAGTGGWQTWVSKTCSISGATGVHNLYLKFTGGTGTLFNINRFKFYNTFIPGKIEAENYSAMSGIQTENTGDTGGGLDVGWTDAGDWMDYTVNVQTTRTYTVEYRVASPYTTGQIQLKKSDGTVLATNNIPNTGGWQTWQTVTASVNLTAGVQTLRVYSSAGGWNLNWFNFISASSGIPNQVIEAESGTYGSGAVLMSDANASGGYCIGSTHNAGAYLTISGINGGGSGGSCTLKVRYASAPTGVTSKKSLYVNGVDVQQVTFPNTVSWSTYTDLTVTVTLSAGTVNTIKFQNDIADGDIEGVNFDKFTVN
jgi:xylan 1,4-beta-xylosidase